MKELFNLPEAWLCACQFIDIIFYAELSNENHRILHFWFSDLQIYANFINERFFLFIYWQGQLHYENLTPRFEDRPTTFDHWGVKSAECATKCERNDESDDIGLYTIQFYKSGQRVLCIFYVAFTWLLISEKLVSLSSFLHQFLYWRYLYTFLVSVDISREHREIHSKRW